MCCKKDEDNTYFERIDMRPNRTPKQHRVVMNRMGKIFRLFKPEGMSNGDWYYNLTNKISWI